jgi:hypothetical protein
MWRQGEEFGRFEGTGQVSAELAELELPETELAVSVEDFIEAGSAYGVLAREVS